MATAWTPKVGKKFKTLLKSEPYEAYHLENLLPLFREPEFLYQDDASFQKSQSLLIRCFRFALSRLDAAPLKDQPHYFRVLRALGRRKELRTFRIRCPTVWSEFIQLIYTMQEFGTRHLMEEFAPPAIFVHSFYLMTYCFFENPHVQQLFLQALTAGSIPRHDTAKVEEYMAQYLDKPTPKIKKKRRTVKGVGLGTAAEAPPRSLTSYAKLVYGTCLIPIEVIKPLQAATDEPEWTHWVADYGKGYLYFVIDYLKHLENSSDDPIDWDNAPGYLVVLKSFFGLMISTPPEMYGDKMTRATSAFIANNKLLPIFVRQLLTQTNAVVPDSVAAMFSTINAWLQAVKTVQGTIPSEFDVEYFKTALVTLLNSDHYRILAYALVFVYQSMELFPPDLGIAFLSTLMGDNFYKLFLHWSPDIRTLFIAVLCIRLTNPAKTSPTPSLTRLHKELLLKLKHLKNQVKRRKKNHKLPECECVIAQSSEIYAAYALPQFAKMSRQDPSNWVAVFEDPLQEAGEIEAFGG